jgi:hypothetical protein
MSDHDENNAGDIITSPSPARKKLDSMVLGDGSFEALMKERSKVRYVCCLICGVVFSLLICTLYSRLVIKPDSLPQPSNAKRKKNNPSLKSKSNSKQPNEPSPPKPPDAFNPPTPLN